MTFTHPLMVWETLLGNKTSWSSQSHCPHCTAQKGPWSSVGVRKAMQVWVAPVERTPLAVEYERVGDESLCFHLLVV